MAVPKRRHSKSRKKRKKAGKKEWKANYSLCPKCSQAKLPHRVCMECGFYGDREVFKKEE
ncbi:MAG: 50S ribosomal protein L32 [Elusimicrobiota bacterium]